jgi:hypothetical protein
MADVDSPSFRFLPLTIGIETLGGIATPLVLRGSPLPATRTKTFTTAEDDQEVVTIRLVIGERPLAKHCVELAKVDLKEIPPAPRGESQIEVTVTVDTNCQLNIVAKETRTQKRLEVETKEPNISLDQNTIQNLMDEAEENREQDKSDLRDIEIKNKANQLLAEGESRLKSPPNLSGLNVERLDKAVAELGLAIQSGDVDKIRVVSSEIESTLKGSKGYSDVFGEVFGDIFGGGQSFASAPRSRTSHASHKSRSDSKGSEKRPPTKSMSESHHVFGSREFTLDPSLCFVLMPFDEALKPVYDDHIRGVVEGESLTCVRADEIVGVQQITADIWEYVNRARFLIADLTNMNANVFYELGLAHALAKPVILLTQSIDHVPFDLKAHRCLIYEFTPRGMHALEQKLRRTIREIVSA